mmetsp:Transcript_59575/g.111492  ORF Transcript_59575/g.111492 Transcript_59575/m.111492 type:complete len:127 (+) Transcript_59575:46-426(+)
MFACCAAETPGEVEEIPPATAVSVAEPKVEAPAVTAASETPSGAVFTFQLPDKSVKEVTFASKPLGLDFSKAVPMTVKAVKKDSLAEQLRIQPKWIITHVNGKEVPSELKEAMKHILQEVKDLPQK